MTPYTPEELAAICVSPDDPVGQCRLSVDETSNQLRAEGVEHTVIEGRICPHLLDGGRGSAYHWYLTVSSEYVRGATSKVVVDPTVGQFSQENFETGRVEASFPKSMEPAEPIILADLPAYAVYE